MSSRSSGKERRRQRRVAISSVHGFIMIYLLVIASLQVISSSPSSGDAADAAAQRAHQVDQLRSVERLQVSLSSGGNVTITNDAPIPSTLSFLFLQNSSVSREVPIQQESLAVGASFVENVKQTFPLPSFGRGHHDPRERLRGLVIWRIVDRRLSIWLPLRGLRHSGEGLRLVYETRDDHRLFSSHSIPSRIQVMETPTVAPSFLVLNSTRYVALVRNSTGYGGLVLGTYSP